ncbi:Hypothetical protein A7982_05150 [Minicystis rosea]|nr:Hypothetical protein A7982_05150 [Minicystis rosea]
MSAAPRRSIAFLDLHARADQFQDDAALGALAAELEAEGHEVSLVRSVLAADPGGAPAWHARLAAFVREGRFDLVVLARVWDETTVDVLRRALDTGSRLVRLTSGVRAALDDRFDHVLDFEGLARLLGGEADPAPAAFRPVKPAELRRRAASAPSKLRVLAPSALPGLVEREIGARPTISGPASGCPFLLDAGKSPIFAGLGADPAKLAGVQMKGCTFCLDNTGSFAAPTEAAVLDAWLGQLRRHRAENPHLREVLLTDERPHPYLPAFFRALLADPSLGPIELLWKSRVDWLLEFADTTVAEAAALAAEHGSVLHLYLVGFESFDQFHLDLFNKGVTVADNVAAIEKMRALGARFPRSFEYRRHRAHGVVLFTPWTTPESLLENARWMRRVRFHELRSEAVRTRLRLYPRVPLHALAEKDGLLVSSFDEGRPDRAAEQGYDASVPWRFQHPHMEAIFRAANDFGRASSLPDADLLEIATRLVTRHPGLAKEPDVAWLPLRQALRSWGGPGPAGTLRIDASLLGADPEIELILRGHKRACLKEAVLRAEAEGLCRAYRAMGLVADIVELHGLEQGRDAHERGTDYAIVAVAADRASLDEVLTAQRAHASAQGKAAVEIMGALMGYPPCCVQAFLAQRTRGDNLDNERLTFRRDPGASLHPFTHRIGGVRLLSHHPCSPSCPGSIRIGEQIFEALSSIDEAAATLARERIHRPVLFLDYQRRLELQGAWEGDRFRVDHATSLDEPRHLGVDTAAITAVDLTPTLVRFHLRGGARADIRSPHPLLTTPGAPLAPAALAAIGGPLDADTRAPSIPSLPAAFRPGVRVHEYRITAIDTRDAAHAITLARDDHRFVIRARPHDPAQRYTLRRGIWALDIDDAESLPPAARMALGVLVRALPER